MHLSILLEHMLEGNEKLFLGVSVCHMNSSSKCTSSSSSRVSSDPNTVWRQISRTEVVTNSDVLEYGKTIANRVTKQFKILLEPVILEECSHVMIVLFKYAYSSLLVNYVIFAELAEKIHLMGKI